MGFINKISGVSYSSISKVGTTLKANIQKVSGVDKPPTCVIISNLAYGSTGAAACQNTNRSDHYYDETNEILYTDSCGGTEATYGFYSNGGDYREYNSEGLSAPIASCGRSDRRLKQNISFKYNSKSGIPIYEFEYINESDGIGTYVGTMAQDLIKLGIHEAVITDNDGYYFVDYSKIDVPFFKV